jgi:16S rRNA C967 or C1407 C5-methylase (RsmB/RsmF family)
MKKYRAFLWVTFLATVTTLGFTSCKPMTKESYLRQYDDFITEVSKNHRQYDEKDWKKMTREYEKFSGEWFKKFENDLTIKDEIAIKAKQAKWYYYRYLNETTSTVKQLLEALDIKGMKKQIQYYIDNNMQDDLQKFYKEAQKMGEDAQKAISEILEELDVKIDELKQ